MSDHVYKKIELVGSSKKSIEEAVNNAVDQASQSIRDMRWFEVSEIRGHIADNKVEHWQVGVKIGFTIEGSKPSAPAPAAKKKGKRKKAK